MRRRSIIALGIALLLVAVPGVASAAKPDRGCGAAASGFMHVDRDGWWDASVVGFGEAGIPVYELDGTTFTDAFNDFAAAFGLTDGATLEAYVRGEQWAGIDANDNGWLCLKDVPNTPGSPGYIFNGIDDSANANH